MPGGSRTFRYFFIKFKTQKKNNMEAKQQYLELKQQWLKAKGKEREQAQQQLDAFFAALTEEEKQAVCQTVSEDFRQIHRDINEIKEIKLRDKLQDILDIVSVSYLAKHYFHKSASWFYQRLNGNKVHGKTCTFTKEEMATLAHAFRDISQKIHSASTRLP